MPIFKFMNTELDWPTWLQHVRLIKGSEDIDRNAYHIFYREGLSPEQAVDAEGR